MDGVLIHRRDGAFDAYVYGGDGDDDCDLCGDGS